MLQTLMTFVQRLKTLNQSNKAPFALCMAWGVFFFALSAYHLFHWPIFAGDTDLWYHLASGRYISEHHAIPTDSFFSFLAPPRAWVDYSWLFQILVYRIYLAFGYEGLVFLRNFVYLTTAFLIFRFVVRRVDNPKALFYGTFISMLYMLFLLVRGARFVRPHLLTYLFIVAFLTIFEHFPRKVLLIPLLAVLWCNLHGIAYPLILLICTAYLLEWVFIKCTVASQSGKTSYVFLICVLFSVYAIFLTPHGNKLFHMPFISTELASLYISEFKPIALAIFSSFHLNQLVLSWDTMLLILIILALFALIKSFFKVQLRVSHLVLAFGGAILALKGNRFAYECVLLMLPLIRSNIPSDKPQDKPILQSQPTHHGLMSVVLWCGGKWTIIAEILLIVIPLRTWAVIFVNPPKYPFSTVNLPAGVGAFINKTGASGVILNHPNKGGYFEWELYPAHKILMDMEVPHLFTDEDMFVGTYAFLNEEVLRKALSAYDPSFISVPISFTQFRSFIQKFPDYVMVFFDDIEVLYINRRHHPDIALRYKLSMIDPFSLKFQGVGSILIQKDRAPTMRELRRLLDVYPNCLLMNQLASVVFSDEGSYDRALEYAQKIILEFPESPTGYGLKGDALLGMKMFPKAILSYEQCLKRAGPIAKNEALGQLSEVYTKLRQYTKAYRILKKAIQPFSAQSGYKDLFRLGSAALRAGKSREAALNFRLAFTQVPQSDVEWYERLKEIARLSMEIKR